VRGHEVTLPERLDLDANYSATISAMHKVRLAAQRQFRMRYLNFDHIRHISPSAALLLASEIDRWNDSIGGRIRARDDGWDPAIRHLLCEMGLFELLGLKRPRETDGVVNTTFLPFVRGNVGDRTQAGIQAKQLRQQIEAAAGTDIKKHLLFDGLTEAVTNVCQHAYRKRGRRSKRYSPWWMSAAYAPTTNTVTVTFYDHGLTIPGTLPASQKMERWKHRLGWWDDGQRIRAAMTIGRSSTGKSGRGKGLQNFLELIAAYRESMLVLSSRHGRLSVRNTGRARLEYRTQTLENPVQGTLIEWHFVPKTATNLARNAHFHR